MTNVDRMRGYMAHLRAVRRAQGLCPRCGLVKVTLGKNCADCNAIRRYARGGFPVASTAETGAHSP